LAVIRSTVGDLCKLGCTGFTVLRRVWAWCLSVGGGWSILPVVHVTSLSTRGAWLSGQTMFKKALELKPCVDARGVQFVIITAAWWYLCLDPAATALWCRESAPFGNSYPAGLDSVQHVESASAD